MPLGAGDVEIQTEFAIHFLLTGQGDVRRLVHDLVTGWPAQPALDVIFVLAMAAGHLEQALTGPGIADAAQDAWRMAGLVGVDLSMMERLGVPNDTAADLLAYWKSYDRFFLS